ncbi:hypothetical protein WJX79_000224 [Trebouxia sp. C0005]
MLTHFQLFSEVDTQRGQQWRSVIKASIQVLQQQLALHPETGLLADFLVYNKSEKRYKPSKGKILERDSDGDFGYNACRVPWRLAVCWLPPGWQAIRNVLQHLLFGPCLVSLQGHGQQKN